MFLFSPPLATSESQKREKNYVMQSISNKVIHKSKQTTQSCKQPIQNLRVSKHNLKITIHNKIQQNYN